MSITPLYLIPNVLLVIRSGNSIQSYSFLETIILAKIQKLSLYPIKCVWEFNGDISKRPKLSLYPIYHYIQYILYNGRRYSVAVIAIE